MDLMRLVQWILIILTFISTAFGDDKIQLKLMDCVNAGLVGARQPEAIERTDEAFVSTHNREIHSTGSFAQPNDLKPENLEPGKYLYLIPDNGKIFYSKELPNPNINFNDETVPIFATHRTLLNQLKTDTGKNPKIFAAGEFIIVRSYDLQSKKWVKAVQQINNRSNTFHGHDTHLKFAIQVLSDLGLPVSDLPSFDYSTGLAALPHLKSQEINLNYLKYQHDPLWKQFEDYYSEWVREFQDPELKGVFNRELAAKAAGELNSKVNRGSRGLYFSEIEWPFTQFVQIYLEGNGEFMRLAKEYKLKPKNFDPFRNKMREIIGRKEKIPAPIERNPKADRASREFLSRGKQATHGELELKNLKEGKHVYVITEKGDVYFDIELPDDTIDYKNSQLPFFVTHRSLVAGIPSLRGKMPSIVAAGEFTTSRYFEPNSKSWINIVQQITNRSNTYHGNKINLEFAVSKLGELGLPVLDVPTYDYSVQNYDIAHSVTQDKLIGLMRYKYDPLAIKFLDYYHQLAVEFPDPVLKGRINSALLEKAMLEKLESIVAFPGVDLVAFSSMVFYPMQKLEKIPLDGIARFMREANEKHLEPKNFDVIRDKMREIVKRDIRKD